MAKPRLLHMLFSLAAEGCPKLAFEMVRPHDRNDYEAAVAYCVDTPSDFRPEFEALGIPLFHLRWRRRGFLPLVWRTYQLCREWKPDGIICYTLGFHLFMGLGAWLSGVRRMVVHIGNAPPTENPWQCRQLGLMLHLGRPFTRYEVTCSHHVRELAQKIYKLPPTRIKVIYNAAPVEEIHARAETRRMNGGRSPQPVVGMVGRLEPHKDQATLLEAFRLVARKRPDAILRLVGEGSERRKLEALTSQLGLTHVVQFLGNRSDIPEQLADMEVFVFSTTASEGFGVALVEALAAGVPVVATDVGACREVLEEGRYGYLAPQRNPQALADAILALLESPQEQRRLGAQGYPYVLQRFNSATMRKAYEEALFG